MPAFPESALRRHLRRVAAAAFAFGLVTVPLGGALAGGVYVLVAPVRRRYRDRLALAWIGVFGGLATLLAPHPVLSLPPWLGWLALGVAFVLVARRWSPQDARFAGVGFSLGAMVTLAWELRQRIYLGEVRPEGFTAHPNLEAGLLLAAIGASGTAWPQARGRPARWSVVLGLAAGLAALWLTGSRGAVVGFVLGALCWLALVLWRFSWRRLLPWLLGLALLLAAGFVVNHLWRGGVSRNVLAGSGFEWGGLTWELGDGSSLVRVPQQAAPARKAARLVHSAGGWQVLLAYVPAIAVTPGESMTLSLWARPAAHALGKAFVRVRALRADGSFLKRAGRSGWATGNEGRAGGRFVLPVARPGVWRRASFTIPPLPSGSALLKLEIADGSGKTGVYGEVAAPQLEKGTVATPYVPGRRPGLGALIGPVMSRWLRVRDPTRASGGRIGMWWFGLQMASYRPVLGYGPGSELRLVRQYALDYVPRPLAHLHSFYLKMLVEGGSVTLAALLVWLGMTAWRLFERARSGSAAAAVAAATLVALLVHSVFDPVLSQSYIAGSMWLVVCSGVYGEDRVDDGVA